MSCVATPVDGLRASVFIFIIYNNHMTRFMQSDSVSEVITTMYYHVITGL